MSPAAAFCAHCGTRVTALTEGPSWLAILGSLCLALLAVPLGLTGSCFLLLSLPGLNGGAGPPFIALLLALLFLGLAAGCVYGIVRLTGRK